MTGKLFRLTDTRLNEQRTDIEFSYRIETDEQNFDIVEALNFPVRLPDTRETSALIRALHIALSISYYKAFLPPIIEHPYSMTDTEAGFWNGVWRHGLGEFLYKNGVSSERLAQFTEQDGSEYIVENTAELHESSLLGIGGGKDSALAGELLKEIGLPVSGFIMGTGEEVGQARAVADVMGVELNVVKREVDRQIIGINKLPGALNGHIPISAIFALVGSLLAVATGNRYVVVANEASASIPRASWENNDVNHQWSKSIEFERLFQDYLHAYVNPELCYFSAIRPLTSVAIAKLFAGYPQYLEVFSSDNSLLKINREARDHPRWSLHSSKSLSSFILLSAWLKKDDLLRAFGRNFLDEPSLQGMFTALLGGSEEPVLDCVGTPAELRASLKACLDQGGFADSYLVKEVLGQKLLNDDPVSEHLGFYEDALPEKLKDDLLTLMRSKL